MYAVPPLCTDSGARQMRLACYPKLDVMRIRRMVIEGAWKVARKLGWFHSKRRSEMVLPGAGRPPDTQGAPFWHTQQPEKMCLREGLGTVTFGLIPISHFLN
jgi:hypothetical protein